MVVALVFAMILQVFVMGAAVVGLWGFDGGCVGFWVCSWRRERERERERERKGGREGGREILLLQIYILLCRYIILMCCIGI